MKIRAVRAALSLALFSASGIACQAGTPAKAASAKADSKVAAQGAGISISLAELDARAAARLVPLRQQEYDIRKDVLDEMVAEALEAKEAQARGVTLEALVKAEVTDKVPAPTKEAVDLVYAQNKSRLGGQTLEQVQPSIEKFLRDRDTQVRRQAFRRSLFDKAGVKIALAPPRVEVPVPANAPVLGPDQAPVTMVAFTDYQCTFCHRAQGTVDEIMSRYAGKVRLVHQDFPLDSIHPQAASAARGAWCAGEQGKFWEYYKSLMTVPGDLSANDLAQRATGLKLEAAPFAACVASDRHDATIREGAASGARLGVSGTPAYFINGRMLTGAQPIEQFQEVIDAELAAAR
jgi:protein-disulfide isomerase